MLDRLPFSQLGPDPCGNRQDAGRPPSRAVSTVQSKVQQMNTSRLWCSSQFLKCVAWSDSQCLRDMSNLAVHGLKDDIGSVTLDPFLAAIFGQRYQTCDSQHFCGRSVEQFNLFGMVGGNEWDKDGLTGFVFGMSSSINTP